MKTTLHLIRHAETTANATRTIAGWSDVPLSERGHAQARQLGALLGGRAFDHVWSSDLNRTLTTARLAGYDPRPDPRVRELNFGDMEGQKWEVALAHYAEHMADFARFAAPGGESVVALRDRVFDFVTGLPAGEHAVFCHGGVIRVVLAELGEHRFVPNCARVEIDWSGRIILGERLLEEDAAE